MSRKKMIEIGSEIAQVIERDAFTQVMVPEFNDLVWYKFMEKMDHVLLLFMLVEEKLEHSHSNSLLNQTKKLQNVLEKKPYLIHQAIRDQKFRIQEYNTYKGLQKIKYFQGKRVRIHYYNEKPVVIGFITVIIDDSQQEICSRMMKKQISIRIDHVPKDLLADYLADIYHYHDIQLQDEKFNPIQNIINQNEKVFTYFMIFVMLMAFLSLIEAFIRAIPAISFPMILCYVIIAFIFIEIYATILQSKIKASENFMLYCPPLYGYPFEIIKEKKFSLKIQKPEISLKIENNQEENNSNSNINVERSHIIPLQRLLTIDEFRESALALLHQEEFSKDDLILIIRNMLVYRYGFVKNLKQCSSNLRKILSQSTSELKKIEELMNFNAIALAPLDSKYRGHEIFLKNAINLLVNEVEDENLKNLHSSILKISNDLLGSDKDPMLDKIMEEIEDLGEINERISENYNEGNSNLQFLEKIQALEPYIESNNGEKIQVLEKLKKLTSDMIISFHKEHVRVQNNGNTLLDDLISHFSIKNSRISLLFSEINDMMKEEIPNLQKFFFSLIKLNKAMNNGEQEKLENIFKEPKQIIEIPIISVTHEHSSEAKLLDLTKKSENLLPSIKKIKLSMFKEYWKYPRSLLLIYDQDTSHYLAEFSDLLRHLGMQDHMKFSLDISGKIEWIDIKTPLLIYKNEKESKLAIEEFDPSTLRDLIEDTPLSLENAKINSFFELQEEIIRRIGKVFNREDYNENSENIKIEIEKSKNEKYGNEEEIISEPLLSSTSNMKTSQLALPEDSLEEKEIKEILEINDQEKEDTELKIQSGFLEDNYHERIEELRKVSGKPIEPKNYKNLNFGIHPKMDFEAISNKEDLKKALKIKRPVMYILHHNDVNVREIIPKIETTIKIRTISLEVFKGDPSLQRLILQNFNAHEGDFDNIKLYRRERNSAKVINLNYFWDSLERNHEKIITSQRSNTEKTEEKIDSLSIPNALIGVMIAEFDNSTGPEIRYKVGQMNGDSNLHKIVQNVLDDPGLEHLDVSYRKYKLHDFSICVLIRKEFSEEHDRNFLLEAYLVFLKLNASSNLINKLEEALPHMNLFQLETIQDRGNAFYYKINKLMEKFENEI